LQNWYTAAKTIAEETALEYGEKNELLVVTVCPCIVLGPLLQPLINTTSEFLIYIIKGGLYIFLLVSTFKYPLIG
jgi:nucleoside-diphosphate-sugar epimerase